jgi:hypothetical protein
VCWSKRTERGGDTITDYVFPVALAAALSARMMRELSKTLRKRRRRVVKRGPKDSRERRTHNIWPASLVVGSSVVAPGAVMAPAEMEMISEFQMYVGAYVPKI